MAKRKCRDCGTSFNATADWMIRCLDCYFKHKNGASAGYQQAKDFGTQTRTVEKMVPDSDGEWFRKNIRALLILCHPDKHGNTDLAHDISIFLTKRYGEIKKGA